MAPPNYFRNSVIITLHRSINVRLGTSSKITQKSRIRSHLQSALIKDCYFLDVQRDYSME